MNHPSLSNRALVLPLAALLALPARLAAAPVPLVDPIAVLELAGSGGLPSVAAADDGRFLVAWASPSPGDGSSGGIRARSFSAAGVPASEFVVNTFTTGNQTEPEVDMNGGGDFTILWSSPNQANATSNIDLVARQSTASGTLLGAEQLVETAPSGIARMGGVAVDPTDGFVAAWSRATPVLARQFGPGYSNPSAELTASADDGGNAFVDVGVDADGNFVVVWNAPDGDGSGIFARLFASDGTPIGAEFPVNQVAANSQFRPRVAMAANGEFVVVWYDINALGEGLDQVELRRFRPDGSPAGADTPVSPADGFSHFSPDVDCHADGAFVVVWHRDEFIDGDVPPEDGVPVVQPQRVFSREYDRTGRPLEGPQEESAFPQDALTRPDVAVANASWVTVWSGSTATHPIAARRYLRRSVFADGFETVEPQETWSQYNP